MFNTIIFSSIYPVGDYFFLLKIADYSKDYHPESKIIMDIPAALNFFLKDPQFTRNLIKTKVDQLASAWNKKFYQTDATVYFCQFPIWCIIFYYICTLLYRIYLFLQTRHTRSHFSDYSVISTHVFKQKRDNVEKNHTSEIVLSVNNWHFVKDNLYKAKTPACQADDCSISIKLSSTIFRSELQAADSSVDASDEFYFDKNGAVIPYPALKELLHCDEFYTYMEQVKIQFEADSGSKAWQEDNDKTTEDNGKSGSAKATPSSRPEIYVLDEEQEGEEEEEEEEVPLKVKKPNKQKADKKKWGLRWIPC